jgi:hypothetical protein
MPDDPTPATTKHIENLPLRDVPPLATTYYAFQGLFSTNTKEWGLYTFATLKQAHQMHAYYIKQGFTVHPAIHEITLTHQSHPGE